MDIKYDIVIFGKNLKKIRKNNGLLKQKMAKKIGIGTKSLTSLENGILPPRLSTCVLIKVFNEFDFLPSEFFEPIDK